MKIIFTLLLITCSLSSFAQSNSSLCYRDADEDRHGDPTNSVSAIFNLICPVGYVSDNTDCDDHNASIYTRVWYRDLDNDGYYDGTSVESCTQPAGYRAALFSTVIDCDDNNADIQPIKWYIDNDHDGYSLNDEYMLTCTPPGGNYVSQSELKGLDCNDA